MSTTTDPAYDDTQHGPLLLALALRELIDAISAYSAYIEQGYGDLPRNSDTALRWQSELEGYDHAGMARALRNAATVINHLPGMPGCEGCSDEAAHRRRRWGMTR